MPTYTYTVRDSQGKMIRGAMDAADGRELRQKLDEKNYFIIDYAEKSSKKSLFDIPLFGPKKAKLTEVSVFSWQLYTMLDAGLPLINALKTLETQMEDKKWKSIVQTMIRRIEEGASFSEALREHPHYFSRLYVQMAAAGEVGGVLDEMVRRLAEYLEKQAEVQSNIRSALSYPAILLTACIGVAFFLVTFVLPKFMLVFEDLGTPIPGPTQFLLNVSTFLREKWYLVLIAVSAIVFFLKLVHNTKPGRIVYDRFILKIPVIGMVVTKSIVSQFAQTLSILVSSGITILVALEVAMDTIDNTLVVKVLKDVSVRVKEGRSISQPLDESKLFPQMVVNMINVGEETGELDKMLAKVASYYTREVDNMIKNFTKIIEPVLIIFMTIIVGFIAVSIFMPLTDIMQSMG
ncbi:MAG: type II secretion system F family protein [Candidatus Omnitrophica bacterium]|nr:type II secretion system F family protein [Candidatus Omnitrophota bacterium]